MQAVEHVGSVVAVHGLCCPEACGMFSDQGSNPCPVAGRFFTTGSPGKSSCLFLYIFQVCEGSTDVCEFLLTAFHNYFLIILLFYFLEYIVTACLVL